MAVRVLRRKIRNAIYSDIIIINKLINFMDNKFLSEVNNMINFSNKKTQRTIAGVIAGILIVAMVVGLLL